VRPLQRIPADIQASACALRALVRLAAHFRGAGLRRSARAHWFARLIPLTDVSRRYFPSYASSASSSACGARFSARDPRSYTGHLRVTGPPNSPASCRTRTDRQAPLMRFRLLPFGVRRSRRTARSNRLRAIPLRRCSQPRHPRQEVGSPMRFLAPRVSGAFPLRGFGDAAARVIRGRFLSGLRTGPAPDCSRDLAGTVKVPATPMGFT